MAKRIRRRVSETDKEWAERLKKHTQEVTKARKKRLRKAKPTGAAKRSVELKEWRGKRKGRKVRMKSRRGVVSEIPMENASQAKSRGWQKARTAEETGKLKGTARVRKAKSTARMVGREAIGGTLAEALSMPSMEGGLRVGKGAWRGVLPKLGLFGLLAELGIISWDVMQGRAAGKRADQLELLPEPSTRQVLRGMRQRDLLAAREGRLARNDPEAYMALQRMLSQGGSPLATGEFRVGGPPDMPASSEDIQAALSQIV